jgi:thioester reductase-like protein
METLARLIDDGVDQIIVLVRADDDEGARQRLAAVMTRLYDEPRRAAARVCAVRGDLLEPGLGLSREDRQQLVDGVDRIIHCAASISFELPLGEAQEINVRGVARVVDLAREIAAGGRLHRVLHVSTAYVSGCHAGRFGEHDLDVGQEFRNTYERSKHEAEHLVREASELPTVIVRPSIVVGHRVSGWTPAFNVIYWPMRAAQRGLLEELPARPDSIVDFVPVDYVADGLIRLLHAPDANGTYHLVAGVQALNAGELVGLHSSLLGRAPVRLVAPDTAKRLPQGAESYVPYFDVRCSFDDARARQILERMGVAKPDPRDYLSQLIAYAHETRWGKRPLSRQAAIKLAGGSRRDAQPRPMPLARAARG